MRIIVKEVPARWCTSHPVHASVLFILLLAAGFHPGAAASWFKTQEQEAVQKFEQGDYSAAASEFSDSYRRGVALYRAGRYTDAGEAFESVEREDVKADALYNLGNTRYKRSDYEGAVDAYEQSLRLRADDEDGKPRLSTKARGPQAGLPALGFELPVTAQLQASNGECWEASYATALRNDAGKFEALSD